MRAGIAAVAVAGLLGLSALAAVGGRSIDAPVSPPDRDIHEPAAAPAADGKLPTSAMASGTSGFERVAPREPLSELSLALPPEPKVSDEWEGAIMHRAVAPSAGLLEAPGHVIAIAGTEAVAADERCTYEGRSWNCGLRARTAFRGLLRGRSPTCALPPEAGSGRATARCRIGTRDLGEWLVANGWARAAAGGPYVAAEARARESRLGIFGPPPDTSPILVLPDAPPEATPSFEYVGPADAAMPPDLRQEPSE